MKKVLLGLLCLITVACQSNSTKENVRPNWILNPGAGAVGSCPTHLKGRHAQEEYAIALARTRLAAAMGVAIDQVQTVQMSANNTSQNIAVNSVTKQVVKNKTVKAHVKAIWYDKPQDTIWAWLYPVK